MALNLYLKYVDICKDNKCYLNCMISRKLFYA